MEKNVIHTIFFRVWIARYSR